MSEKKTDVPLEEEAQATAEEQMEEPTEELVEEVAGAEAEDEKPKVNIADELQQLGRNLTAGTKTVLDSPEAQEVNTQLHKGLESLEKTVGQLVKQARESTVGQKVESGVGDATTVVKERGFLETLAGSFASALHTVNVTLEQAVDKAQTRAQEEAEERSAPQPIEVVGAEEEETPAEAEASEE